MRVKMLDGGLRYQEEEGMIKKNVKRVERRETVAPGAVPRIKGTRDFWKRSKDKLLLGIGIDL